MVGGYHCQDESNHTISGIWHWALNPTSLKGENGDDEPLDSIASSNTEIAG